MIVVKVELWSAVTGLTTELARMVIANDGTEADPKYGNYEVATLRGRSRAALEKALARWVRAEDNARNAMAVQHGRVVGYPRLRKHVWNLVAAALGQMGYR
jgi:hypothetical protein